MEVKGKHFMSKQASSLVITILNLLRIKVVLKMIIIKHSKFIIILIILIALIIFTILGVIILIMFIVLIMPIISLYFFITKACFTKEQISILLASHQFTILITEFTKLQIHFTFFIKLKFNNYTQVFILWVLDSLMLIILTIPCFSSMLPLLCTLFYNLQHLIDCLSINIFMDLYFILFIFNTL